MYNYERKKEFIKSFIDEKLNEFGIIELEKSVESSSDIINKRMGVAMVSLIAVTFIAFLLKEQSLLVKILMLIPLSLPLLIIFIVLFSCFFILIDRYKLSKKRAVLDNMVYGEIKFNEILKIIEKGNDTQINQVYENILKLKIIN